ncbi:hypothetical protein [Novosphingobium sp.]|uniref:hypothetical protein n=1 Tax=Novosphingobium sp. TaxID=1874826 RepID=UPI0025FFDF07|nr:hypothetical protein [Novosphingobium sp.]
MRARAWGSFVVTAAMAILLTGCLLLPGKFTSDLTLKKDGSFGFTYKGEIFVLALSRMAAGMNDQAANKPFETKDCKDDATDTVRPCKPDEIAQQKQEWQDERDAVKAKATKDAETAKAMLGGIDPTDPKASEQFAQNLARQAGWKSVVSKGDGRFEVEYAIAGRLDHDFTFPTVERMPFLVPFVSVIRRNDGTVRIDAPAFSSGQSAGPLAGMAGMAGALGGADTSKADKTATPPGFPRLDGHFTVHTDGTILANNTDEGPKAEAGMQRLEWLVNPQTTAPPTALIRF